MVTKNVVGNTSKSALNNYQYLDKNQTPGKENLDSTRPCHGFQVICLATLLGNVTIQMWHSVKNLVKTLAVQATCTGFG